MNRDQVYEFIEEADKREIMELMDAVANRFWELFAETELMIATLPKKDPDGRKAAMDGILSLLKREESPDEDI